MPRVDVKPSITTREPTANLGPGHAPVGVVGDMGEASSPLVSGDATIWVRLIGDVSARGEATGMSAGAPLIGTTASPEDVSLFSAQTKGTGTVIKEVSTTDSGTWLGGPGHHRGHQIRCLEHPS